MGAPVAHLKLKDLLFCRVHFYVSVSTTGAALARPRGCRRARERAGQAESLLLAPLPGRPLSSQGDVGAAPEGGAPGRDAVGSGRDTVLAHHQILDPARAEKPRPGELAAGWFPQDSCTSRSPGQSSFDTPGKEPECAL